MPKAIIGIRREDINPWERRAPLTPREVDYIVRRDGLSVLVQPSDIRIFKAAEYEAAGATVAEDLGRCGVIFAVKEIPLVRLLPGKAYVFFSHVIKGQASNMPMLARMCDLGCSIVDYEKVVDSRGRRLLFFGRYAGLAGMLDALWALGQRLKAEGRETPFAALKQAIHYDSLDEAYAALATTAAALDRDGLPPELVPLVVGFAGYGNVSQGAQEILAALPVEEVAAEELHDFIAAGRFSPRAVYKVVFKEEHMVKPRDAATAFRLQDYYDHPEKYEAAFAPYLPYFAVLVNGIYWDARYPRLVTKAALARLYGAATPPRLKVIADVSCDVEGAVEATVKVTASDAPGYVFDAARGEAVDAFTGRGPYIIAVYNLPAELPRDASAYFGARLLPYVPALAHADWTAPFDALALPEELRAATILHRGELTPAYRYLNEPLAKLR